MSIEDPGSQLNVPLPTPSLQVCPQCHQPVRPEFYFCPNCGANLRKPPLSTSVVSQALLYLFSAILPWIAYLAVTKWEGVKYMRSPDPLARRVGWIALAILVISSVIAFWMATVWINQQINAAMNGVNGLGGLGGGL